MVFVFLLREVFKEHANNSWDCYDYADYKFAVRAFKRYLKKDREVIEASQTYQDLEDDVDDSITMTPARKRRRRTATTFAPTPDSTSDPVMTQCVVDTDSSDDRSDDDDDGDE